MKFRKIISIISILIIASLFTANAQTFESGKYLFRNIDKAKQTKWVDSVYNSLSIDEAVAQLIMPMLWIEGTNGKGKKLEQTFDGGAWGGILFQRTNIEEQANATRLLQSKSKVPLLISLDGEWGLHMRIKNAPRYPRNMAIAASNDRYKVYEFAKDVARQMKLMGIHINFSPVADVNINPKNPVIGTRSFSENTEEVIKYVNKYSLGLEENGIMSVAKHFPGHGDTSLDSHKTLPKITANIDRLKKVELAPFLSYIQNGYSGIMIGHLNVPALDNSGKPSSFSKKIVTDLLQKEMGFNGLIFTDALEMQGAMIAAGETAELNAFLAGNDILLASKNPKEGKLSILRAISKGLISIDEIKRRVKKILAYKYALIIHQNTRYPAQGDLYSQIWTDEAKDLQESIWQKSIKKQPNEISPFKEGDEVLNILIGVDFSKEVKDIYLSSSKSSRFMTWTEASHKKVLSEISNAKNVAVHLYSAKKISSQKLDELLSSNKNNLFIAYTSPYSVSNMGKKATNTWIAFESVPEAYKAVAQNIVGSIFPEVFDVTHLYEAKDDKKNYITTTGITKKKGFEEFYSIMEEALNSKAFPGAQVFFSKDNTIYINESFGTKSNSKSIDDKVDNSTIYDLASLTKAIATTPAVMLLSSQGKLNINAPIKKYIKALEDYELGDIRIKELLLHESGLPSGLPFYQYLIDSTSYESPLLSSRKINKDYVSVWRNSWANSNFNFDKIWVSSVKDEDYPLEFSKGIYISKYFPEKMLELIRDCNLRRRGTYKYSDLNFILLQMVVENITKQSLDKFVENNIFKALGTNLVFRPLDKGIEKSNIAPSQYDAFIRKSEIRGTVDDESAACLGGVSGNAGLFGTAEDVAKFAKMMLNNGKAENGKQIIPAKTIKEFTSISSKGSIRYLGFDKSSKKRNDIFAESASARTYGHLGFTGTAFWIDPVENTIFVFLSNRTYPNRNNNLLGKENYRPRLHQACYEAILMNKK